MPFFTPDTDDTAVGAWPHRWGPLLLALPDALLLCGGLVLGYAACSGAEALPHGTEWGTAAVLGVYGTALAASGAYRLPPRQMGVSDLLRLGAGLVGAWGSAVALTYAIDPAAVPPHSVLAVLGAVALIGIPGVRVGYRGLLAMRSAPPDRSALGVSLSPTRLEDLVPRDPVAIDRAALRAALSDRTVLVTGAGGVHRGGAEPAAAGPGAVPDRARGRERAQPLPA